MNEQLIFYSMNDNKIILDVESTGLDSENNYIAQLSYLIIGSEGQIAKNFFFSVPKMEKGAEDTHGLSMSRLQELSGGKTFRDHADEILNDFRKCNLCIGHNISFDLKFIKKEFERLGIKINYIQDKIYCTMHEYTDILKLKRYKHNDYKWPKLSEVVNYLNLYEQKLLDLTQRMYHISSSDKFNGYHDSRFDVICTYMIYLAKEAEDNESKELVYYTEKSNKNVNIELKKSKNSILKDLFSFKGEISRNKYAILIWFLIILRAVTLGTMKYNWRNNIEFESFILAFIIVILAAISSFLIIPLTIKRLRTKKQSFWLILCIFIPIVNFIFICDLCTRSKTEIQNDNEKKRSKGKNRTVFKMIEVLSIVFICLVSFKLLKGNFYSEEDRIINKVRYYEEDGINIEDKIKDTVIEEVSYGWNVKQIFENTYFVYYEYDDDNYLGNGTRIICYEYYSIDDSVVPVTGKLKDYYIKSGHLLKNSELIIGDLPVYCKL